MTTDPEITLHFCAALPSLHGGEPPGRCPVCGSEQVPPESDDGIPPPEQHQYRCDASYLRPEDEPGPWEPCHVCGRVPLGAAAAWIRGMASKSGGAGEALSVIDALGAVVPVAPPFEVEGRSPLGLVLGTVHGERAPDRCPSCGAATVKGPASFWTYACGARFWATSTRPGPTGPVAMSWQGIGECPQPPLERLLEVLRAAALREGALPAD